MRLDGTLDLKAQSHAVGQPAAPLNRRWEVVAADYSAE